MTALPLTWACADNREFEEQIEEYDIKAKEERARIEAHKQSYTAHFSTLGVPPGTVRLVVYIVLIVLLSGNLCAHQLVAVFASTEGV